MAKIPKYYRFKRQHFAILKNTKGVLDRLRTGGLVGAGVGLAADSMSAIVLTGIVAIVADQLRGLISDIISDATVIDPIYEEIPD